MLKHRWLERARYAFDLAVAKGTGTLIAWLLAGSGSIVLVCAILVYWSGVVPTSGAGNPLAFLDAFWMTVVRVLDAGAIENDRGGGLFLAAMLGLAVGGVFAVSTLTGIIASGIASRLHELRKGRSRVIEDGHTVILGWNAQVFTLVAELCAANAGGRRSCVVLPADMDKVEMEDALRLHVPNPGRTRIVCRSGDPLDHAALELASPHTSSAIIVLSPETPDPDAHVVKTILAITNHPNRRADRYHVVAQVRERAYVPIARLAGGDEVQVIDVKDLIARITVQTCRQPGLSVVYRELMDFGGDEIYFAEEPRLTGCTFREALFRYDTSAVIGVWSPVGGMRVNPPMETRLGPGDRLIAIAQHSEAIVLAPAREDPVLDALLRHQAPMSPSPECTLLLDWNELGELVLRELDQYLAPGSEVVIVTDAPEALEAIGRLPALARITLSVHRGDPTKRLTLEGLDLASFHHIVALSDARIEAPQGADARMLVLLLHLRDLLSGASRLPSVVSHMRDARNAELATVTRVDDFIVSDLMASLMLTQIAENPDRLAVFEDILDADGSEIYLRPVGDYVVTGQPVTFYTVLEAACRRGEVAIGYHIAAAAEDVGQACGIYLNPVKSREVVFAPYDRVIVFADS